MSRINVALDFNMSPRVGDALNALFSQDGYDFIHMEKLVAGHSQDTFWADVFKKFGGHVVLSGDCRIAYKPHQAVAFVDNAFISFFPAEQWNDMKGTDKAAMMIHAWPRIAAVIQSRQLGTCWRIPCLKRSGVLRLIEEPLVQLKIPHEVLETARTIKRAS